ncbi:hypothetical protein FACS189467_0140 [Bacteroidia bacterium]|nr:hypothetical protein FACS189467_0140 [Bacteroidia bacterium]
MEEEFSNMFESDAEGGSIIKVIGVGGGGCNAVNYMFNSGINDVSFVVCNTDAKSLNSSPVSLRIQLGKKLTEGLGAGSKPEQGRMAAEESLNEITAMLQNNTKMVFITAGMGGGTGTGAAPVIAKAAKDMGILTVAIVTIPFNNEPGRAEIASRGIEELKRYSDSLLVINNNKLSALFGSLKISQAFAKANEVLCTAAKNIVEIITVPGHIAVDFADVRTAMQDSGIAIMGTGRASGTDRAIIAIEQAMNSPLLYNNSIKGARNVLVNIMSSDANELSMDEFTTITDCILKETGKPQQMKTGIGINPDLGDEITVSLIATGFEIKDMEKETPKKGEDNREIIIVEDPWDDDKFPPYSGKPTIVEIVGVDGTQTRKLPKLLDPSEDKETPAVQRNQKKKAQINNNAQNFSLFTLNGDNEFVESTPVFLRGIPD